MVENGAIEEVEKLLKSKLDPNLTIMKALGVAEIKSYLEEKNKFRKNDKVGTTKNPPIHQKTTNLVSLSTNINIRFFYFFSR